MNVAVVECDTMNGDTLDVCLSLVADRRRRKLLEQLRHNGGGAVQIDALVDHLFQAEPAAADDRQSSRDQLAIELYHSHLPKLADQGIVDYDRERGTIEYRPDDHLETVLNGLLAEPSLGNP